jgi:hypothetical protein
MKSPSKKTAEKPSTTSKKPKFDKVKIKAARDKLKAINIDNIPRRVRSIQDILAIHPHISQEEYIVAHRGAGNWPSELNRIIDEFSDAKTLLLAAGIKRPKR